MEYVDELENGLPELPDEKKARFMRDFGLSDLRRRRADRRARVGRLLRGRRPRGATASSRPTGSSTSCSGASTRRAWRSRLRPISAAQLGAIVDLIASGTISGKIAKDLFEIVWAEGGDPAEIVEARGLKQVTDTGAIEKAVDEIIAANPGQGRAGEGQAADARLVRRPGDEGDRAARPTRRPSTRS